MLRSIALFAVSVTAASSLAVAAPPIRTVVAEDGVQVKYTVHLDEGALIRFDGRSMDTQDRISLIVQPNGRVRGKVGQRPVNFSIGQVRRDKLAESLKARETLQARMDVLPASQSGN